MLLAPNSVDSPMPTANVAISKPEIDFINTPFEVGSRRLPL